MKKTSSAKPKRPTKAQLKGRFGNLIIVDKLPGMFLLFSLLVLFGLLFYVLSPFLTVILIAAFLAIVFYPVFKKLRGWFGGYGGLASFVSCLILILVLLIPLALIVTLLSSEALDTYDLIQKKVESGVFDKYLIWDNGGFFYELKEQIKPVFDIDNLDLKQNIIDIAGTVSAWLVTKTADLLKGIGGIVLGVVVLLFTLYYFFKDGEKLVERIGKLSPLPLVYENQLFKKIHQMIKAIIFGVFFTSIVQGVLGGIGFAIAGISNPVFWGVMMAFFSLVPVIGTALVWGPAVIVLAILGEWGSAIFLALWGVLLVGSIDNIIKPYLIGNRAQTYPLVTFLVVLGGILVMDLKGIIIGPLVLVVLMSFLHVYEAEYNKLLKK